MLSISDVRLVADRSPAIAGFVLDRPRLGETEDVYSLFIEGSVVGAGSRASWVECGGASTRLARRRVDLRSPDAAARHPDLRWARQSGFQLGVTTICLPPEFDILLKVGLQDGDVVPLAVIKGRRRRLPMLPHSGPLPLGITSLGRSGSTWLSDLLHGHPEIVSLHPYRYEPRLSAYWAEMLAAMAAPSSHAQALATDELGPQWWLGRTRAATMPMGVDPAAERWLGCTNVEEMARFCKERIQSFYRQVIPAAEYERVAFFAEKLWPGSYVQTLLAELFPQTREVILVRDFRDVACSALAYSRRKGSAGFGREAVETDEDYIRGPLLGQANVMLKHWRIRSHAHLLRYEDLVLEPHATLSRLLGYLEVDASDDAIERMLASTIERQRRSAGGESHQTAGSTEASVGRWRRDLTEAQLRMFDDSFGEVFEAFGYEPSVA